MKALIEWLPAAIYVALFTAAGLFLMLGDTFTAGVALTASGLSTVLGYGQWHAHRKAKGNQ